MHLPASTIQPAAADSSTWFHPVNSSHVLTLVSSCACARLHASQSRLAVHLAAHSVALETWIVSSTSAECLKPCIFLKLLLLLEAWLKVAIETKTSKIPQRFVADIFSNVSALLLQLAGCCSSVLLRYGIIWIGSVLSNGIGSMLHSNLLHCFVARGK